MLMDGPSSMKTSEIKGGMRCVFGEAKQLSSDEATLAEPSYMDQIPTCLHLPPDLPSLVIPSLEEVTGGLGSELQ